MVAHLAKTEMGHDIGGDLIESLIKAKGFEECVAVINGDKANIIVKSEGLRPNQLSQILEIVYLQADILPANVTISEK